MLTPGSMLIQTNGSLIEDPSVMDVLGDFTLRPDGLLTLDIAGETPDLISQLDIGGTGTIQGTIDLNFIDDSAPTTGESFDIINALSADFSGASFDVTGLAPGFDYSDMFAYGEFTVTALNDGTSTTGPEPSTALLVGDVLAVLSLTIRRKRKAQRLRDKRSDVIT